MKSYYYLLAIIAIFLCQQSFAQQSMKYDCSAAEMLPGDPEHLSDVNLGTAINIEFLATRKADINVIEFMDSNNAVICRIRKERLSNLFASNTTIVVNTDKKIAGLPKPNIVPFPFKIKVTYNGVGQNSTAIIGSAGNPPLDLSSNGNVSPLVQRIVNPTNPDTQLRQTIIEDKYTGLAYYDALVIRQMLEQENYMRLFNYIDKFYNNDKRTIVNKATLVAFFQNKNSYLEAVFSLEIPDGVIPGRAGAQAGLLELGGKSMGGLDVTNIADGFARFIVKRTKEELSVAFFQKFKEAIKDDKFGDLKSLFPQTYKALDRIDSEIYMYKAYIQTLREAFENDLSVLPDNLPAIMSNHQTFFNGLPELKAALNSGFYVAGAIHAKQHPGEIIEYFPEEDWDAASVDENYKATFKAIKAISKSFKDPLSQESYWVDKNQLRKIYTDDVVLKIYLGLLVEETKKEANEIVFKNGANKFKFSEIINSSAAVADDYKKYKAFLKDITQKAKNIEAKIETLESAKNNDSLAYEAYYGIVTTTVELMRKVATVQKLPKFPTLTFNIEEKTKGYFDSMQSIADIAVDVNRRNYASAVMNVVNLCDVAFATAADANKPATKLIFKYGTFMATIAQAKNSSEVEAAIEAFALPSGSATIKRETNFNVSLNAYCGLYIGAEKIDGIDDRYKINSYGVTAPIGVAISIGKQEWFPFSSYICHGGHWSKTLFISIVDLGALASFRFSDEKTESVPKVELKDIISPGLFYSVGIPRSPVSLNFGYQIGPLLRNVTPQLNTLADKSYSRWSFSVVVDIPLLNLYTTGN